MNVYMALWITQHRIVLTVMCLSVVWILIHFCVTFDFLDSSTTSSREHPQDSKRGLYS